MDDGYGNNLDPGEVYRRVNVLRNGCEMSRMQFGDLVGVKRTSNDFQEPVVAIGTTRHTIYIPMEVWIDLGRMKDGDYRDTEQMWAW